MELADQHGNPPVSHTFPKRLAQRVPHHQQRRGINSAQQAPDDKLGMLEADDGDERLAQAGEQHSAEKRARHGTREGEVVVRVRQARAHVAAGGRAVDEDVVGRLHVERLLDFGVGGEEQVHQGDGEEQGRQEGVFGGWIALAACGLYRDLELSELACGRHFGCHDA